MINHFNAFISYKHAELDNKVAASIVRDLERFHIPRKIQKATGVKKIERIFRDKDELPITSDLGDTISQALKTSDFLIVICSHNTKRSTWVEREIEYFLKNHTMDHILTVLAEGEPYEVIPKILLSGSKTVLDKDGNEHQVEIPFEPLSCDYRMPYRQVKAQEVPRLAAAIIGCSYDELINRQRQYKMRRLTAIFAGAMALSVGFGLYMLHSKTLIQENYIESLRNQSIYLANESEKKLDDQDRIGALQLALESLPKTEADERPVTPEAEKAITRSTLAYTPLAGSNISAAWNYSMPNAVDDYILSEGVTYLAAIDNGGTVSVWETKTHNQVVYREAKSDKAQYINYFGKDKLMVLCEDSMSLYDLTTGDELWIKKFDDDEIYTDRVFKYSDDSILICGGMGRIEVLSVKDGSVLRKDDILDITSTDYIARDFALSEDGKKLVFTYADRTDFMNTIQMLGVFDFDSKTVISTTVDMGWTGALSVVGDNIFVAGSDEDPDSSLMMFDYTYLTDDTKSALCYSSEDLSLKWGAEVECNDVLINQDFLPMVNGTIAYYMGSVCAVFDQETGENLGTYHVNDPIVDVSDKDKDGEPLFITQSGKTATPSNVDGVCGVQLIDRFTSNIVHAKVGAGVYTNKYQSNDIIYYQPSAYDEEMIKLEDGPVFNLTSNTNYMDEEVLAILSPDESGTKLILVDPAQKTYIGELSISKENPPYNYTILGTNAGKLYIASVISHSFDIAEVDIQSQELKTKVINPEFYSLETVCSLMGDKLVYCNVENYDTTTFVIRNLADDSEETIDVPYIRPYSIFAFDNCSKVYLVSYDCDMIVDLNSKSHQELEFDEDWEISKIAAMNENGNLLAVTNNKLIKLFSGEGEFLGEISCMNVGPLAMSFETIGGKELLLVAYDNGFLYRYNTDGEVEGKSDISVYAISTDGTKIDYDSETGLVYISFSDMLDVVDTDKWLEIINIIHCYGYNKETDTFLTSTYSETKKQAEISYFEHYTTGRLIDKAQNILGSLEMSDEEKSLYGIK